jgi:peptidyl-prolyl cis-trans isomerase C
LAAIVAGVAAGSLIAGSALLAQVKGGAAPAAGQPAQPAAAAAEPAQPAVPAETVVLQVGDAKMTAGEFDAFLAGLPPDVQMMAKGPQKRRIAEDVVKLKLLSQEAQKRKLNETPRFKQQMEFMKDNALAGLLINDLQTDLVKDEDIKKYYDEHKQDFEEVTARHILVQVGGDKNLSDDQAKAKATEIKRKLDGGADFAALAKTDSDDPGSKDEGGDLLPFRKGRMVKEFEAKAFELQPNQISDPVKTRFGYHIIQTKKKAAPSLDEVKEEIVDQVKPQKLEQYVEGLRGKAEAQLNEQYFGPANAAAAPAPGAPGAQPAASGGLDR